MHLHIATFGAHEPALSELDHLPAGATITKDHATANVLLLVNGAGDDVLSPLLQGMPNLKWIHSLNAGIDYLPACKELQRRRASIIVTNARGVYSHALAEYVMAACSYFAKDIPRMMRNKDNHLWEKFTVQDLRGQTMGIVGYGDIGSKCAHLAKAYGMRVVGLRRRPELSEHDDLLDEVYLTMKKDEGSV